MSTSIHLNDSKSQDDELDASNDEASSSSSLCLSLQQDDFEVARDATDSENKSEDIFCNYGDKVLIEVSENELSIMENLNDDSLTSEDEKLRLNPNMFFAKARFFADYRTTVGHVAFDNSFESCSISNEEIAKGEDSYEEKEEEEKKYVIFNNNDETSSDYSSLCPSKSYSSINEYLNSISAKKSYVFLQTSDDADSREIFPHQSEEKYDTDHTPTENQIAMTNKTVNDNSFA